MRTAIIGKVKDTWGALGNMSPHPIVWRGPPWDRELVFPRSEHLFQAMRFPSEHPVVEELLKISNPMQAKMRAKSFRADMVVPPCSSEDLANMNLVLWAKLRQHGDVRDLLRASVGFLLVEDCTRRAHGTGSFWGAVLQPDGSWVGENWLGRLWMEIRDQVHPT